MVVRAVRPIKAGEEITVSYIDPLPKKNFDTTSSRRTRLQRQYRFSCKCTACEKASDDRKRKRISMIEKLMDPNFIEEEYKLAKEVGLQIRPNTAPANPTDYIHKVVVFDWDDL